MNRFQTASGHPVVRIAFSPDGATLAVAQPHFGITLVDRASGQAIRTIKNSRAAAYTSVAFADDGSRLAVSTPRGLGLYDVATRTEECSSPQWGVKNARFVVRNGKILIAAREGVWEVSLSPPAQVPEWRSVWDKHHAVAISSDGRWALGLRARLGPVLIDLAARKVCASLDHPARYSPARVPPTIEFATTSSRIMIGDGRTISVFDPEEDAPDEAEPTGDAPDRRTKAPKPRPVLNPVFQLGPPETWPADGSWLPPTVLTPDGRRLLVRRPRNQVQLWDVESGRQPDQWSWRLDSVTCLAIAPDGLTAVAGGRFGRVVAWDLE